MGYSPWGPKSWSRPSTKSRKRGPHDGIIAIIRRDTRKTAVLEKEMAAHSNILVREIQWTEEPGRLQPMGLQKCQTRLRD